MKRLMLAPVLFVAIYFAGCMLIGATAGAIAGYHDPVNAQAAGQVAGQNAVIEYRLYIAAVAGVMSVLLTLAWSQHASAQRQRASFGGYAD